MKRRTLILASGAVAAASVGAVRYARPRPRRVARQKGVSFDLFRSDPNVEDLLALKEISVTHISVTPFAFMPSPDDPDVIWQSRRRQSTEPVGQRFRTLGELCQRVDLDLVIIPTISNFRDGRWRADIQMRGDAAWDAWFRSYGEFVSHYAGIGSEVGAAGLCVGTELKGTTSREHQWRALIRDVRSEFAGWLTYAANWDDYHRHSWWDAVDLIGVQAYFELGNPPANDRADRTEHLVQRWNPVKRRLKAVGERFDRPILFTEIGYESHARATERPWDWRREESTVDNALQADAYSAAFTAFWDEPWFAGTYWWKWYPSDRLARRDWSRDFTPQGKPAMEVLRKWYLGRVGD